MSAAWWRWWPAPALVASLAPACLYDWSPRDKGTGGGGATDDDSTTECVDRESTPRKDCPGVCTACDDGVCSIVCDDSMPCFGEIKCPAGLDCRVDCAGAAPCTFAEIICPADFDCVVACDGMEACEGAVITCSEHGRCDLECGSGEQVCRNTLVLCGDNACTATCSPHPPAAAEEGATDEPKFACGDSCACTPCERDPSTAR
jgi:hypothetical protein